MATDFEIFLATAPGLEPALCDEARTKGFRRAQAVPGGVTVRGDWPDVWRANLWLRGTGRVIARLDRFRVEQLAELEDRARRVRWSSVLRSDVPVRVEASCTQSRLYHSGAVAERVTTALRDRLGVTITEDAAVTVMVRIDNDVCDIGVDTSGELLHKRGYKIGVNRAPMRETFAALFLRQCGYDGREPVVDPMCGSGTFVIEAAEMAAGFNPGRLRAFAFEHLATFDGDAWQQMRGKSATAKSAARFYGSDRDADAIAMSIANAERAGVAASTKFEQRAVSELTPPDGPPDGQPGLVIVNPPYGDRIGDKARLGALYHAFGEVMMRRFSGWRVGLVTSDKTLAYATALPFLPPGPPVAHGGLRITLFRTEALK